MIFFEILFVFKFLLNELHTITYLLFIQKFRLCFHLRNVSQYPEENHKFHSQLIKWCEISLRKVPRENLSKSTVFTNNSFPMLTVDSQTVYCNFTQRPINRVFRARTKDIRESKKEKSRKCFRLSEKKVRKKWRQNNNSAIMHNHMLRHRRQSRIMGWESLIHRLVTRNHDAFIIPKSALLAAFFTSSFNGFESQQALHHLAFQHDNKAFGYSCTFYPWLIR